MSSDKYIAYVDLMLKVLPYVANEKCFSLKGGTAINLFVRNMPRLSIDIDLAYVGTEQRDLAFKNAESALARIKSEVEKHIPKTKVLRPTKSGSDNIGKLFAIREGIQIKIEANPVIRGTAFDGEVRDLVSNAENQFGVTLSTHVVSIPDLYGGKLVAALDRQHPRDLFDVKMLFDNEGLTDDIIKGFLVYLSSHKRPLQEVISPTKKNQEDLFNKEFIGMTNIRFSYGDFEEIRNALISEIHARLSNEHREYLLSLQQGNPKWSLLGLAGIENLPAVKWKLENIQKMHADKKSEAVDLLKQALKI